MCVCVCVCVCVCETSYYPLTGSIPITFSDFGAGEGLILLSNVACTGEEANLAECRHRGIASHTCDHGDDSGVVCQGVCVCVCVYVCVCCTCIYIYNMWVWE